MKITIEYEASWRNSFLDGSNNEPLPKGGRNFIGSIKALNDKKANNYIERTISKNTVMGILNRLIGDQRKLYQSRQEPNYYFSDIEEVLQDNHIVDNPLVTNEMAYIRNVSGSTDQNAFTGLIRANDPAFKSPFSSELWGVLWLSLEDVVDYILDKSIETTTSVSLDPITVIERLETLNGEKPINIEGKTQDALERLKAIFSDVDYKPTAKGQLTPINLYTSALYLRLDKLKQTLDLSTILTDRGGLSGISKRGFTKKDFMARYTTGAKKLVWGNPYIKDDFSQGIGKTKKILTKASGTLEITLDIPKEKAKELNQLIENAGVSAFYLGKKGLAYVSSIKI
jgi:hypothetical protein